MRIKAPLGVSTGRRGASRIWVPCWKATYEMMQTWMGRDPRLGGMVVIPWNTLARYIHAVAGYGFCNRCGAEREG